MPTLPSSELGELAFRVIEAGGPNTWMVVVTNSHPAEAAMALHRETLMLGTDETTCKLVAVASVEELDRAVRANKDGVLFIAGLDSFSEEDWLRVDLSRSRLARNGTTVLVASEIALGHIEDSAPNLASWIGGEVWRLREPLPLDSESAEKRLAALRAWAGKSDAEILRLAQDGALPNDPPYAEWVALLKRGDLLVE